MEPASESQAAKRSRPRISIRNIFIGLIAGLLIATSFWSIGHPTESFSTYSTASVVYVYAFCLPALIAIAALALWDKRHLKERFPKLKDIRTRHYIIALIIVFCGSTLVLSVLEGTWQYTM